MKALTWQGNQNVEVTDVPDPQIEQPTDAIIKVTSTAICGSDLHLYGVLGPYLKPGDVLGHEAMGIVQEVGSAVTHIKAGDRVVVPFNISCGHCWMCERKLFAQCETTQTVSASKGANLFGYTSLYGSVPGGQSEFLRVPQAQFGPIKVPEGTPDEQFLFLSDVLPTAWQAVAYADPPPGGTVAIFGLGPIGQMAVRIAKYLGAGRVIGIDSVPERLALAERHGAEPLDLSKVDDVSEALIALVDGRGPDATIDAVGMEAHGGAPGGKIASFAQKAAGLLPDPVAQKVVDKMGVDRLDALLGAIKGVRRGGTVSVSGVYGGEVDPLPMMEMFDRGIQLRMGQAHVKRWTDDILPLVLDPADPLGTLDLTTHHLPLAEAAGAYEMFRDKRDGCIKVVLQPVTQVDAVVIGGGHNGLVAANVLADAGQQVLVLEAAPHLGGAVHSDRSLHPDFVTDWYSSFYPMAAASPVLADLELQHWGLQWRQSQTVLAHILPDGRCAAMGRDIEQTAASLDAFAAGDGDAWKSLVADYEAISEPLLTAVLRPFPAPRAVAGLLRTLGIADLMRFARFAVSPVRTFARENFGGEGAALLLAGNALHTDLAPEAAGSAIYGWLLCMLGQTVGFPVPVGGSGMIIKALTRRFVARGGEVRTGADVTSIDVQSARVRAVRLASGERINTHSVLADVDAPRLYLDLVGAANLPDRLVQDVERFEWDGPTLKVNWALSSPIPWTATPARDAGTVHLGVDLDELSQYSTDLVSGRLPERPFALLGQTTTADPSRSPAGTESAWSYTHIPRDKVFDHEQLVGQIERIKDAVEAQAPGFRSSIVAEQIQTPQDLHSADGNLVHGALGGGSAAIHQQLFFRPVPGLGRAETVIDGLYLASSSAHPGGGVHGAPGGNAAAAALRRDGRLGRLHRGVINGTHRRIYKP